MKKKRVLIPISFSFSIRYIVRSGLIYKLKEFCEPVIVLTWNEKELIHELNQNNIEVHVVQESERGIYYSDVRKKLDYWFRHKKLQSPTWKIEPRYLEQFSKTNSIIIKRLREFYNYLLLFIPGYVNKLLKRELELMYADSNYNEVNKIVESLHIDAVFSITPFHKQEEFLLRSAYLNEKKMITSILSFDNIIKRGWIPVPFQTYLVWNNKMKNELKRIYSESATENNIHIVGAVQFDFYKHPHKYLLPENEWKQCVGLTSNNRKVILYAGGPISLFPQETQFLIHINEGINTGKIKGNPIVLFRCHPVDNVERWKQALGASENIIYDSSWTGEKKLTYTNITHQDIAKLYSTLYYTDIHINVASTMAVDGSAFSKPQIGPAYDEICKPRKYDLKSMYLQEHFSDIIKSGGLHLANSKNELFNIINEALENPAEFVEESENLLQSVITFTDGKSVERVCEILKKELS